MPRTMDLLSSVRFGVLLLILLAAASMLGMVIMQVNVEGFDKYYAELSPATRLLFGTLNFFDIYHSWYFNLLLLVLMLACFLVVGPISGLVEALVEWWEDCRGFLNEFVELYPPPNHGDTP